MNISPRVIHLQTSPLGTASVTRAVGATVVQSLRATDIHTHDLAAQPLPHWSPAWAQTAEAQRLVDKLLAADVLVMEVPMYNFGIPSTLKAWLDTVAVAGKTFHYTEQGPVGHLTHLRVILVSARGGAYGEGHPADFQEGHVRQFLGFLGVTPDRLEVVRAEGLAMGEASRTAGLALAHATAQALTPAQPALHGTSLVEAVTL